MKENIVNDKKQQGEIGSTDTKRYTEKSRVGRAKYANTAQNGATISIVQISKREYYLHLAKSVSDGFCFQNQKGKANSIIHENSIKKNPSTPSTP